MTVYPTMYGGGCCADPTKCENNEWRTLHEDDISGAKEIYGPGGNGGGDTTWVAKETGNGSTSKPVALARSQVESPSRGGRLDAAYPNPFNPTTAIEFTLRDPSRVTLEVYNIAGQLVETVIRDEQYPAGSHRLVWDVSRKGLASGIYLIRLQGDGWADSRKVGFAR